MKVCFDTNVVLDIFARADALSDSVIAYDVANIQGFEVVMPVSAVTDVAYILRRSGMSNAQVRRTIENLMRLFDLYSVTEADCVGAVKSQVEDFEDAFMVASAERCSVDCMVTRNEKDFARSSMLVMSPSEFVKRFCPADYHYDVVDF